MNRLRFLLIVALIITIQSACLPYIFAAGKQEEDRVFDFTAPPETDIPIGDQIRVGLEPEIEFVREDNFDLDSGSRENETSTESSLSIAMSYDPHDQIRLFLNVRPAYLDMDDQNGRKHSDTKFELVQANLRLSDLWGDTEWIIGRQRFIDDRQWLYDEELDGLRYTQFFENLAWELSVFKKNRQDLLSDARNQDIVNFMSQAHYMFGKDIEGTGFVFHRNDYSAENDDYTILGFQLQGAWRDNWNYWLNSGVVVGSAGDNDILGGGADAGVTYVFDAVLSPSITAGYAYGSGDSDPADGTDSNFRQTGFQDNSAKLNGVVDVKTYGELFDPELSNLSIATLGVGIRPTRRSSIDLLYHIYRQNEPARSIRDSQIDQDPNGRDKGLGDEVDLVFGLKVAKHVKLSVAYGYFRPHKAFGPDADSAQFINAEIKINF